MNQDALLLHFPNLECAPDDPILGLTAAFLGDDRPHKVNLGVGAYKDAEGAPLVLDCVRRAEKRIVETRLDKEYSPIQGMDSFNHRILQHLTGKELLDAHQGKLSAMQTLGGTGALRILGEFFAKNGKRSIYIPDITWGNHRVIFSRAGLEVSPYTYYDNSTHSFAFEACIDNLVSIPEESVILLHSCCHNPTGVDPSEAEWDYILATVEKKKHFPLFDCAYQGFGRGVAEDVYPIRRSIAKGMECAVAYSCSKNLGLYGERVGAAIIASAGAGIIISQLKQHARASYSMPPLHGARIAHAVLSNQELTKLWLEELGSMRARIEGMRRRFSASLQEARADHFSHLSRCLGMFCFLGLDSSQMDILKEKYAVYALKNSRINVAGLTESNLDYVVDSILHVL